MIVKVALRPAPCTTRRHLTPGAKTGTFYPPVKVTGTGKDALKEKTKALMSGGTAAPENDADKEFGPKYHSSDGDSTNLPIHKNESETRWVKDTSRILPRHLHLTAP